MKKIAVLLLLMSMLSLTLTGCGFTTPRPEIKSAEFNFSVTYEYAGQVNTVSGVYVCEYAGVSWALDGGYSRDWTGYINGLDDNDHIVIDALDGGDEVILVLNLDPDYFMDDYNMELYGSAPAPYIMIKDYTDYGDYEGLSIISEAEMVEELCGARIISYDYDEPIDNEFGFLK